MLCLYDDHCAFRQTLSKLAFIPELSSEEEAVYAREFEAQIGYHNVPLRQEFHIVNHGTPRAKLCLVVFSKLEPRTPMSPGLGVGGRGY